MMKLPFTIDQFLNVFSNYNQAIWPIQIFTYIAAIIALYFVIKPTKYSSRLVSGILAAFWLINGVGYHLINFATINKAAYMFGALFLVQTAVIFIQGVVRDRFSFQLTPNGSSITGAIMILYAMVIYPASGYVFGHTYPEAPMFGVAPCPTTIFTLGLFLITNRQPNIFSFAIPLLWSVIGSTAAMTLGVREDIGLGVAGLLTIGLIARDMLNARKKPALATQ